MEHKTIVEAIIDVFKVVGCFTAIAGALLTAIYCLVK
tara:strand:- start:753 stop:863 length:111 start_codon:yes stop_codon:yes gene_type:complete